MRQSKEYILCSAIWINDGESYSHQPVNIIEGFVVCGRRHHNCFTTLGITLGIDNYDKSTIMQGFLTSKDRFVDRKTANIIAVECDQVDWDVKNKEIYSEDLW